MGGPPDYQSWEVGQCASLLLADCYERPRRRIVGLGDWVRQTLEHWWGLKPAAQRLAWYKLAPRDAALAWSPHPAGAWWDDPTNKVQVENFWAEIAVTAERLLPRPPAKVSMAIRGVWLLWLVEEMADGWPEVCVDWPWVDPPGRPQALLRGNSVPAAQAVLDLRGEHKPSIRHQALHSCDRGQQCVNARHLRWGLELENRLDQSARARGDIGRVGLDVAREVRRELEEISERRGVPLDAIARIAGGKTWTDEKWETD